jgi:hypothetical protein
VSFGHLRFGVFDAKMGFGEETLEGEAGSVLLSLLLGGSLGFGESARASFFVGDADFDAEALLMVGAALVGEDVVGLARAGGLEMLLQGGFVIADGSAEGVAGVESDVEAGDGRLDYAFFDEGAGSVESSIEVERGYDGFESVGEESGLLAAAALLFPAAETEMRAEADGGGDFAEMTAADERGAEAGEFAFSGC